MENLGGGYRHKLTALITSICLVISGWIISEMPVYAATNPYFSYIGSTVYLYIPTSCVNGKHLVFNPGKWVNSPDGETSYGWGYSLQVGQGYAGDSDGDIFWKYYIASDSTNYTVENGCYKVKVIATGDSRQYDFENDNFNIFWSKMYCYNGNINDPRYLSSLFSKQWNWGSNWHTHSGDVSKGWIFITSGSSHSFTTSTATCTSAGTKKCSVCGYTETQAALGHSWGSYSAYSATQHRRQCSRCKSYDYQNHTRKNSGDIYQNRDCTKPELRYQKCTVCGNQNASYTYQSQAALGHAKGAAATCTTAQKCTRCSATLANALGHNWQTATLSNNNGIKIQPDVYTDAVYYQKCSRCSTGHSGDPYTNHFNVVPGTQKHFNIYLGSVQIKKIYRGETLVMNAFKGTNSLVG